MRFGIIISGVLIWVISYFLLQEQGILFLIGLGLGLLLVILGLFLKKKQKMYVNDPKYYAKQMKAISDDKLRRMQDVQRLRRVGAT